MTGIIGSIVSLCVAAAAVGLVWVGCSMAYFPLTQVDLDEGRALFESRCATCHTARDQAVLSYGPNLTNIATAAATRVPDMSAEEYLLESIIRPNAYKKRGDRGVMPADIAAGLRREEVVSIVGYLMTLGGSPQPRRLAPLVNTVRFDTSQNQADVSFAAAEAGKQLFLTKGGCIQCHRLRELPGSALRAPSLLTAANHDANYLRESLVEPNKSLTPGYERWNIWLDSGKIYSGRLLRDGDESIDLLVDESGTLSVKRISKSDIEKDDDGQLMMQTTERSTMPGSMESLLSEQEIDQIVAFLLTLKASS